MTETGLDKKNSFQRGWSNNKPSPIALITSIPLRMWTNTATFRAILNQMEELSWVNVLTLGVSKSARGVSVSRPFSYPSSNEQICHLATGTAQRPNVLKNRWLSFGWRIVFGIFFASGFGWFFGFLSWYHLPCICNSLELEPVILHGICYILHGICYIWAWSLCILHGICYMWPCSPSILHGICHILPFQPLICMVFATVHFGTSKVHVGLLRVL